MAERRGPSVRSWWASSNRVARGAVIGAFALVIALLTTSGVVWTSPNSPADQVGRAVAQLSGQPKLVSDRNQLLSETVAMQAKLKSAWSKTGRQDAQLLALKSQLAEAQAALSDTQAKLGEAQAAAKSGSPGARRTTAAPAALVTPTKAQIMNPANPYFGLYTDQAPFNYSSFDLAARKAGSQPGAVGFFAGWDQPFRSTGVVKAWQRGMVPVYTWEGQPISAPNGLSKQPDYALSKILAGSFDAYLHQWAKDVVATGLPFVLRLDHEMNADWYPWSEGANGNTKGQYVAMWKHVHDIFEAEGANQYVIWLWSPNRIDNLWGPYQGLWRMQRMYPGPEYVDWIGMSGYYRSTGANLAPTFDATYARTLAQLRTVAPGKRIFLSEVGATEIGGNKPTWITSFFQGLNDPANADIVGFGWFNLVVTSFNDADTKTNDFRLEATAQSTAAFSSGLATPGGRFVIRPF